VSIRVIVADDQELVRSGISGLLASESDIDVVAEAENGEEALAAAVAHEPDVIVMDVRMPVLDGIEATRRIAQIPSLEHTRVLILTTFDADEYVYEALRAGASGFLLKGARAETLLEAVRVVASGDSLLAPSVTRRLVERFSAAPAAVTSAPAVEELTGREREVFALIAKGLSNDEIANDLVISAATAKTHVSHVMTKLGARDRAQLVAWAYEWGIVTPGIEG
jgi:DNA-binding NarL/FixJ family response regulator